MRPRSRLLCPWARDPCLQRLCEPTPAPPASHAHPCRPALCCSAGPAENDLSTIAYTYTSSVDLVGHPNAGLIGVVVVASKGALDGCGGEPAGGLLEPYASAARSAFGPLHLRGVCPATRRGPLACQPSCSWFPTPSPPIHPHPPTPPPQHASNLPTLTPARPAAPRGCPPASTPWCRCCSTSRMRPPPRCWTRTLRQPT